MMALQVDLVNAEVAAGFPYLEYHSPGTVEELGEFTPEISFVADQRLKGLLGVFELVDVVSEGIVPWTDFINVPRTLFRGLQTLDQVLQRPELSGNIDLLDHDKPVFSRAWEIFLLYVEPGGYL